jgi:outer membrane protein
MEVSSMKSFTKGLIGAVALVLATAGIADGQQPVRAVSVTFDDAVAIALRQNTSIRQALNNSESSSAAVQQARLQFLPNLNLNVNNGMDVGRNFSEAEGRIVDQTTRSLSTGVSSSVTLFDGLRNVSNLNAAKATEAASEQDVARVRQTVVFTVASNFLNIVAQQEQVRVQEENLKALELQEQQIKTYVDAGVRPISDMYSQQAATANARLSLVNAKRALELAKVDIIQTLQLDPAGTYDFVAPNVTATEAAAATRTFDLGELVARAYENRYDLDAQEARVEAAKQNARASSASKWPSVSLSAGYNTGYNSATDIAFSDQLNERRGGSVSIGVSIPIFDRGATSVAEQRARIQEENARIELEKQRQQVALEIRRAHLDHQSAQEQLKAARAQKEAADQAVAAVQERYRVGASTLVELTQARAAQVQAASALVNARYTLVFQSALMDYYTGELDPEQLRLAD